jgi:DNA-directed RNA polymerase subunit RPC12/RpoP
MDKIKKEEKVKYKCSECGETFRLKASLNLHKCKKSWKQKRGDKYNFLNGYY